MPPLRFPDRPATMDSENPSTIEMVTADLSRNSRLPRLMDMLRGLGEAKSVDAAYDAFFESMRQTFGRRGFLCVWTEGLVGDEYRVTHLVPVDGRNVIDRPDPDRPRFEDIPPDSGGFVGELMNDPEPKLIVDLNVQHDPVLGQQLIMYRSALAAPIFGGERIVGWCVLLSLQPDIFQDKHIEEFVKRANLLGLSVQRQELARDLRTLDDDRRREARQLATLQRSLQPSRPPEIPGVTVGVSHESFDRLGGNMYSFVQVAKSAEGVAARNAAADPRWAIFLADVGGPGAARAAIMTMLDTLIETFPHEGKSASDLLAHLNRGICRKAIDAVEVRAFAAYYDTATHQFDYASAAHPAPLLRRPPMGGAIETSPLDLAESEPLGRREDAAFAPTRTRLAADDTLLLHSSGVSDTLDADDHPFGAERLGDILRRSSGGADDVIERTLKALREHEGDRLPDADQTLIVMRIDY